MGTCDPLSSVVMRGARKGGRNSALIPATRLTLVGEVTREELGRLLSGDGKDRGKWGVVKANFVTKGRK